MFKILMKKNMINLIKKRKLGKEFEDVVLKI